MADPAFVTHDHSQCSGDALARAEKAIKALEKLPKKLWEAPTDQQLEDLTRVTDALRAGAAIE